MSDARREASVTFDPRPLVEPVDRRAVTSFAQQLRQSGRVSSFGGLATVVAVFAGVVIVLVFATTFISVIGSLLVSAATAAEGGAGAALLFTLLPVVVMAVVITMIIVGIRRGQSAQRERWYRFDRFAQANGMSYLPGITAPDLPGMIFGIGNSRASSDVVRGERPRFVEFANYSYTTGSGKNRTTHEWGYVAVKLDVPLPHIVLDATGNNSLFGSNLPMTFDKDQRLGLEGDFDEHFSLSCPAGYERDALYLFTPDIMARFIDNAAALDVEIVDDWLFLYGKRRFSTLDPATWAWLFSVVAALLDKFAQWARWRDDRLLAEAPPMTDAAAPASMGSWAGHERPAIVADLRPPPGVALSGRRLQRGIPWKSIIVIAAVVAFWLLTQTGFLGLFFR